MRFSLRRSLRKVLSNERLYQALAERETDEASRELYQLLARNERGRAVRKLSSLFSLALRLPTERDPLHERMWRRLLILCGPKTVSAYVEWRERRELTVIIAVARVITRLARPRGRQLPRPTSSDARRRSSLGAISFLVRLLNNRTSNVRNQKTNDR